MTRSISEAMHDCIHLLSAAHHALTGRERRALEGLRIQAEVVATVLIHERDGRSLTTSETEAVLRVVRACLKAHGGDGSAPPPQHDTPPGGFRKG